MHLRPFLGYTFAKLYEKIHSREKIFFLMLLAGEQFLSPHGIIHLELTQNFPKI